MNESSAEHEAYFAHLQSITCVGRFYKRYVTAPYLYASARRFGPKILEVGCGIGAGVLGSYPREVTGVDINPQAINHCVAKGYNARLIYADQTWDIPANSFDACILDNVLEHVAEPSLLLQECARVTGARAGLIIAVPGAKGFASDGDHKVYYDTESLWQIDPLWTCTRQTGLPLGVGRNLLSRRMRQFCFVAVYRKSARACAT